MSGHTPGPWMVCGTPPNPCWNEGLTIGAASPGDARRVCDVWNWGSENPMTAANARLIAALFPPKPLPEPEARCKTYTWAEAVVLFRNHDTARRISETPR